MLEINKNIYSYLEHDGGFWGNARLGEAMGWGGRFEVVSPAPVWGQLAGCLGLITAYLKLHVSDTASLISTPSVGLVS